MNSRYRHRVTALVFLFTSFILAGSAHAQSHPPCTEAGSDPDGDGYGWQNNATCRVVNGYESHCRIRVWGQYYATPFCSGPTNSSGWGIENGQYCIAALECGRRQGYRVVPPTSSSSSTSISSSSVSSSSSTSSVASSTSSSSSIAERGTPQNLSNAPLENGLAPPPSVLIVADDSGSMDWELVIAQDADQKYESLDGFIMYNYFFRYAYLFGYEVNSSSIDYDNHHPISDFYSGRVIPTYASVQNLNHYFYSQDIRDQLAGVWRARSSYYNLIYYNPATRYNPWPGYSNADPRAAYADPSALFENSSASMKTIDLTLNKNGPTTSNLAVNIPQTNNADTYEKVKVYLPHYFLPKQGALDDNYLAADECGWLVEIKDNAVLSDCLGQPIPNGGPIFPMRKGVERTDCADDQYCTAEEELQNFANWFSFYRRREFVAKAALSNVASSLRNIRLGYATINAHENGAYNSNDKPLLDMSGTNSVNDLLKVIYKTKASPGGTPLLRALDKSGRYFSCKNYNIFGDATSCPNIETSVKACQQYHTIMMTDGYWQADSSDWDSTGVKTNRASMADNDSKNTPWSGGAFADNNRASPSWDDWLTLADIAMYYYMTDIDPNSANKVPPNEVEKARMVDPSYWDTHTTMHQHMNTYTVGFGLFNEDGAVGTVDADGNWVAPLPTDAVTWPSFDRAAAESKKVEDLKHAAYNGRGQFYDGNNAVSLSRNLIDIFDSIEQGAGAVGAVSFNSQELQNGTVVYAASYNSEYNSGDVVAYEIDPDTGLIGNNGILWRAAPKLKQRVNQNCSNPSDSRNILSYIRDGQNSRGYNLSLGSTYLTNEQIRWLRGQSQDEVASSCNSSLSFRARPNQNGILGDIVHSRPLYVGAPSQEREDGKYPSGTDSYQDFKEDTTVSARDPLIVVGANAGLFHLFKASDGEELMAYAPQRLAQGYQGNNRLSDLMDTGYTHQYYVDLSPTVDDVFIKTRTDSSREWRSVVIGGYRAGGRGYFAIDITDPRDFNTQGQGGDNVLWEFSDLDDPRLGNTFSPPLIAMTNEAHSNSNHGNKWNAIFGNGYNSKDGVARLFVMDLEGPIDGWQNTDYKVVDVGPTPGTNDIKNGLGIPRGIDINADGAVDYAYAGDLHGNVYRFDMTATNGGVTAHKVFQAKSASNVEQPITTRPLVVSHPTEVGAYIVVITTGSWMSREDAESTDIQSIYGFVDRPSDTSPTPLARSSLLRRDLKNVLVDGRTERVIVGDELDWSLYSGWYFDFAARAVGVDPDDSDFASQPVVYPGERAIRNMLIRGGYVFVNTIFPSLSDGCSTNLGGAIMAFNPLTGLVDKPILDFDNDNEFDTSNGENIAGMVFDGILSDGAMISNRLVIQETAANGSITPKSFLTNTGTDKRTGRLSWMQLK